ncbi:MAG: hypothetical protein HYS34_10440, partial [Acidobacteria bacterium]|nr:hypothetical protein [Acidobacteriota bacterium]
MKRARLAAPVRLAIVLAAGVIAAGCTEGRRGAAPGASSAAETPGAEPSAGDLPAQPEGARFEDATAGAGLSFRHVNGATGQKYIPETLGSGVCVFDYDGDSRQDIY